MLEGRIKSPYAELLIYQDEVDNGGHSQLFGNLSSAGDNLFFERENEITQILEQYVSVIDFKYFITEQGRRTTLYHEFYKGKWDEKTFWKEDSLLLRDEIMHRTGFVSILEELVCDYNYYGSTEIDRKQWNAIRKIACDTGSELQQVILELEPWIEENFKEYAVFTILGI